VSAFSRENFGDAELWIAGVGDSEYIEKLKRESSSDENVLWLGHVVATKFLRDIDVLVVPSLWNDTAPLVVQEAFAHGIPVVGAKRGGISELVQPGIGWLYEPGNPNELQWTMRAAYEASSRIDSIARNARQFALKFSRQRMIEQYLDAYADVV
jgi:glycosyltransferase involved in cell wall biosynthesis